MSTHNEARAAAYAVALRAIRDHLLNLPCGIDEDAQPFDPTPRDVTAHIGGLCVQIIDAALAMTPGEEVKP